MDAPTILKFPAIATAPPITDRVRINHAALWSAIESDQEIEVTVCQGRAHVVYAEPRRFGRASESS